MAATASLGSLKEYSPTSMALVWSRATHRKRRALLSCTQPLAMAHNSQHEKPTPPMFTHIPGSDLLSSIKTSSKITVVGGGIVSMACAVSCLTQDPDLFNELALVDIEADKLRNEILHIQHTTDFLPCVNIVADSDDYAVSAGSDICVVTAGAWQREGDICLSLLDRNLSLFKTIIPQLVRHSPDTILLIVSSPVDILTHISWKLSRLPPNRVIGTGTDLDSSNFRVLLADNFNTSTYNINSYIAGEHGDRSMPLWSSLTVANVPLPNLHDKYGVKYTKEALKQFHHEAVARSAYKFTGYMPWAIGHSVAYSVKSLLRDKRDIHTVSVCAKGFYGIEQDVHLSLPSQLGRAGVLGIANLPLVDDEMKQLQESAKTLWETLNKLQL